MRAFYMKTDQQICQFMATGPEAFRVLAEGLFLLGPYRFSSITLKALERRIDGVFEPEGHERPVYLLEFQEQSSKTAWYNLATKLGLYGESHPDTDVRGILVFLSSEIDLLYPNGPGNQGDWFFRAVYLDHFLPEWLAQNPNNPYMAVLSTLGKAKSLKRLLTRRFGSLPDWAVQRIEGASLEQLDLWFDDVLDAESLSNLLNSGPH